MSIRFETQRMEQLFARFVEREVAAMDKGHGFGTEMIFDQSGESFPHISLPLIGRKGSVCQRTTAFRKRTQHILWQFRRYIQHESQQDVIRLPYQTIRRGQA